MVRYYAYALYTIILAISSLIHTALAYSGTSALNYKLIKLHYRLAEDGTYTLDIIKTIDIHDASIIDSIQQEKQAYYPHAESVRLIDAYVIRPNGEKITVPAKNRYTRPLYSSSQQSDIHNQFEKVVLFPQLSVGTQLYAHWQITHFYSSPLGINILSEQHFEHAVETQEIIIDYPEKLNIHWAKRGDFEVSESITSPGHHRLKAVLKNQEAHTKEISMVSKNDILPIFIASTLPSWEAIGEAYWQHASDKTRVTPEIKLLAESIVKEKKGIDAAKLLYNWVAKNIKYIYLPLNASAGFIPHDAADIIKNGFGDCKDHVALLQTLLQAVNIRSEPVLISLDDSYQKLPLWHPNQFNHVIIYLPDYQLYANPTSQTSPFGQLDLFLTQKFVVHATSQAYTAYTPSRQAHNNRYRVENQVTLDHEGNLSGQGKIFLSGNADSYIRSFFDSDKQTQQNEVNTMLSITPDGGFGRVKLISGSLLEDDISMETEWHSPASYEMNETVYFKTPVGVDFRSGQFLHQFLNPHPILYPMLIGAQIAHWSYVIALPPNYTLKTLPPNRQIRNIAGEYSSHYNRTDGDKITVSRELQFYKDIYAPGEYNQIKQLIYATVHDSQSIFRLEKNHA